MRIALLLSYDGAELRGWQRHPELRTAQGLLEDALATVGQPASVHAASRTDAGVHARGQVAHVDLAAPPAPGDLRAALNRALPPDLRVLDVQPAPPRWHARWSSRGKIYQYLLAEPADRAAEDAFLAAHAWSLPDPRAFPEQAASGTPPALDLEAMHRALHALRGTRDFRGLATQRGPWKRTGRQERRLSAVRLAAGPHAGPAGGRLTWITVSGTAFLKHQVRNLVGLLAQVGYGLVEADAVAGLVAARRRHEGPRAPGRGLTLLRVRYPAGQDPFSPGGPGARAGARPRSPGPGARR